MKHHAFVIFRHKYKIISFLLSSLLIVLLVLRLRPPTYEATTQILVKLGREISVPSQDILEGGGSVIQKRRQDIYAEVEILKSGYLIEEVVRKIGHNKILSSSQPTDTGFYFQVLSVPKSSVFTIRDLIKNILTAGIEQELTPFEKTVTSIQNRLEVEPLVRSDTIKIAYSHSNPDMAKQVLNTFLNKYFERHIEVHKSSGMQALFQPQVESYKKKLADIEKKLEVLKEEENIFSLETQKTVLIQQKADIQVELEQTQRDILIKIDKIKRISNQISSQSQIVELPDLEDQNPVIHTLKNKLVDLELQKQQLLHNYSPESRMVVNINSEIQKVKEQLTQEQARILFTNKKDLAVFKHRAENLNKDIKKYVSELKKINSVEVEKKRLEREMEINERNYLRYTEELEESRISEVMDLAKITNVRVIQPVVVSLQPVGLGNSLILMLTASISLFISVCIVFLFEYLDHSIGTARDVEEFLNLPVLGSIREKR